MSTYVDTEVREEKATRNVRPDWTRKRDAKRSNDAKRTTRARRQARALKVA